MASKVLVKIPVNFGTQVGKCTTADIISASVSGVNARAAAAVAAESPSSTASSPGDSVSFGVSCDPSLRITQLEQNIKFLKEQHHFMLTSLHHEVETLRQRNRDLQFQLVFSKGSLALVKSSPSSPEDDSKPQMMLSPKQINVTPLQVEILERDIAELRGSLTEARGRNSCLENIIDEQKKQLDNATKSTTTSDDVAENTTPDPDLVFKLEEAEKVIRRLRRENDEQRRELAMIKANQSKVQTAGGSGANHRAPNHWSQQQHSEQRDQPREQYRDQHRDQREQRREQIRDSTQESHYDEQPREGAREGSRFPPLSTQTQKYWHNNGQRGRWNNSWESGRGAGGSRMLNQSLPTLPGLPLGGSSPNESPNGNPSSAPFSLLSHGGGGGRRAHRGNFRGERGGNGRGGNGSGQPGNRGHWDQTREHRGRDRDRNRDQQGFND